jgi:hypothetical protein
MRKANCDGMFVYATSNISRHIFIKMGFELCKMVPMEEIEIDGKFPYTNVLESDFATSHYLKVPPRE